jgi:hypothetical protein
MTRSPKKQINNLKKLPFSEERNKLCDRRRTKDKGLQRGRFLHQQLFPLRFLNMHINGYENHVSQAQIRDCRDKNLKVKILKPNSKAINLKQ